MDKSEKIILWIFIAIFGTAYAIVINFFRCPIRRFPAEDTDNLVVAPADGKVVVIEEVEENEYFHERRIMVSIFMSLFNVHANWFPVDGKVLEVHHFDGNFHKAWLPKAAAENEHADVVIEAENGHSSSSVVELICSFLSVQRFLLRWARAPRAI